MKELLRTLLLFAGSFGCGILVPRTFRFGTVPGLMALGCVFCGAAIAFAVMLALYRQEQRMRKPALPTQRSAS